MNGTKKEAVRQRETDNGAAGKSVAGKKGTVMYIGPSIKNIATTGTLYNNGLPEPMLREMEKQPAIKNLIVPVGELAAAQKELATAGSALAVIYGKITTG